jgi:hypothetical protein
MPNYGFGLEGVSRVGQLQLDCDPFTRLQFCGQHRGHAAFADVERAPGNAGRRSGTQHGDIHRNGHRVTRNAPADSAQARCRVPRSAHILRDPFHAIRSDSMSNSKCLTRNVRLDLSRRVQDGDGFPAVPGQHRQNARACMRSNKPIARSQAPGRIESQPLGQGLAPATQLRASAWRCLPSPRPELPARRR